MVKGGSNRDMDMVNASLEDVLFGGGCPELTGASPRSRIVKAEVWEDTAFVWERGENGAVMSCETFSPCIFAVSDYLGLLPDWEEDLKGLRRPHTYTKLAGPGACNTALWTASRSEMADISSDIASWSGASPGSPRSGQFCSTDLVSQYLSSAGFCLYGGMEFSDLGRLCLSVTSLTGESEILHSQTDIPAAFIAAASGSGAKVWRLADFAAKNAEWPAAAAEAAQASDPEKACLELLQQLSDTDKKDIVKAEKAMLQELERFILAQDPDVIEGHKLYDEILPYLAARAKAVRAKLSWGRSTAECLKAREALRPGGAGEPAGSRPSRKPVPELSGRSASMQIAGKRYDYTNWTLWGRDLIDSLTLMRLRDVTFRESETFDLAENVQILGLDDGNPLPLHEASAEGAVRRVRLAFAACTELLYPFFTQARFLPYSLQNTVLRGTATKINALLLREYLRRGLSVPERPSLAAPYSGAAAGSEMAGIAYRVMHCDVQSLYPSIMLTFGLGPSADSAGIFLEMLDKLRTFRLKAKELKRREAEASAPDSDKVRFFDTLQSTFKIFINSFYGYLGFAQGSFADFDRAAEVTAKGREILASIIDHLKRLECSIVEYDTDGVYFTAPDGVFESAEKRKAIADAVNAELPSGINVELDGFYPAMYCHNTKNYVLLQENGEISFSGATFRSRTREPYLRVALQHIAGLAIKGQSREIASYVNDLKERLAGHRVPVEMLAKTEILNDSLDKYRAKIEASSRARAAAYEVMLRSGRSVKAGQAVSYYITGNKKTVKAYENSKALSEYSADSPDENSVYYSAKLDALLEQFPLLLPAGLIEPKKTRRTKAAE